MVEIQIPDGVKQVLKTLNKAGYEAYLVGGCVRDALLHKTPQDYDIATSALPEEVESLFPQTIPVGIQHGTVLVVEKGIPIEVTTFREDGQYEDHRHPKAVRFVKDLESDLKRRDFTINAMAWHPDTGLIDPFGGQKDLEQGIIRAVGVPDARFQEDALRILRGYRFAARYGFEIEPETRRAMKEQERLFDSIAVERIVPELEEIMKTDPQMLEQMTTLLQKWIPELEAMKNMPQNSRYHYTDVLHHTLDAMSAVKNEADAAVLWALLLHDTGKLETRYTDEKGDHFPKHPQASRKIARRVMKDLKMPAQMIRNVPELVLYHDVFYAPRLSNLYKLLVERGWDESFLQDLWLVQEGDIEGHALKERREMLENFKRFYFEEKDKRPFKKSQLAITGKDVIVHTGLQGRKVGEALDSLLEFMFYHPEANTRQGCLEQLDALVQKEKEKRN